MIVLDGVSRIFPSGVRALDNVSLRIEDGEFVGIIGPSGAGKTTLLRSVNGMSPVTSGTVLVDGTDVSVLKGRDLRLLRRRIGMMFQSLDLVKRSSAVYNVLTASVPDLPFWRVLTGLFPKEKKIKALELLDSLSILDRAYVRCDRLSGGEMQRVALARTLMQDPGIILADEPVSSLDPVSARMVLETLGRMNREKGTTVVVNMHHTSLALEYAERIIGIRKGRIIYDGKACDLTEDMLRLIYGGESEGIHETL